MKKLLLSAVIGLFGLTGLKAQTSGFEAGAYIGFPMGDASDFTNFNFGVTAAYYWTVSPNFQVGGLIGYDYWTGKEFKSSGGVLPPGDDPGDDPGASKGVTAKGSSNKINPGFIPLAVSARYNSEGFFGGLDLGYAVYAGEGDGDGGFYYRPRVGWNSTAVDIYAFYKGISTDGSTMSSIGVGFDYKF